MNKITHIWQEKEGESIEVPAAVFALTLSRTGVDRVKRNRSVRHNQGMERRGAKALEVTLRCQPCQ
jgi:hypothetical protein